MDGFVEKREMGILFRVSVGNERVDHEIAKGQDVRKSRSGMIFVEDVDIHMLKGWLVGLWMVDVEGRHWRGGFQCGEDGLWSDHGHLFIYRSG